MKNREQREKEKADRRARYDAWYQALSDSEKSEIAEAYNKMLMKLPSLAQSYPYDRFCRQCARVAEQLKKKDGKLSPAMALAEKTGNLFLKEKEDADGKSD